MRGMPRTAMRAPTDCGVRAANIRGAGCCAAGSLAAACSGAQAVGWHVPQLVVRDRLFSTGIPVSISSGCINSPVWA